MPKLQTVLGPAEGLDRPGDIIDSALETVRRHLGMDLAYLSEVVGDRILFRAVSSVDSDARDRLGESRRFGSMFCHHIADGRLPRLIRDTADEPVAMAMPITTEMRIGAHVSVPIYRADGGVFGMFCCLSEAPNPSLNERDLSVMELFADLSASQMNAALQDRNSRDAALERIETAMRGGFHMAFQPIRDLRSNAIIGFEALSRFDGMPYRSPDQWFSEAERVGLAVELELKVIETALQSVSLLPPGAYLSINASPQVVTSGELGALIRGSDPVRLVLEITEHAAVGDYAHILAELAPLRAAGLRLAVDDAGAGYAGLQLILRLRPDLIKLDMSLTRDIDTDDARRSLASALVTFSQRTNARLIAEGIETASERAALLGIGVHRGQGYLLGRPVPRHEAFADAAPTLQSA